jgi:serine/threonine-protein kinase
VNKARFFREARVLGYLTGFPDSSFPKLYRVGQSQGQLYLVREFVEGGTLEQLATTRALTLPEGLGVLRAVADAAQRVHGRGLAHRNLHPANVLVTPGHATKLIGFGFVGFLSGSDSVPAGAAGTPAEVDVRALLQLLGWLGASLGQPLPARLEALRRPGSVESPGEFAGALGSWLREG